MLWVSKALAPAALVVAIIGTTVVVAQPPDRKGGDDKKGRDEKTRDDKRGPAPMGNTTTRPDAAVDAWVKVLVEKIADPHDTVRENARAALVHVGPQAIPTLRKLVDGDDNVKSVAARNVIAMIERGPQLGRPGMGGAGGVGGGAGGIAGFPGGPLGPMGPMGERPPMGPGGERPPMGPGGERPPMGERNPMGRVLGDLNLTEKQEKQVKEIFDSHGKKMMELGEKIREGKLEPMEARASVEKLRADLAKELKEVLNPEQFKKFEAVMQQGPPGPGGRPGGGAPGGPPPGRTERE